MEDGKQKKGGARILSRERTKGQFSLLSYLPESLLVAGQVDRSREHGS